MIFSIRWLKFYRMLVFCLLQFPGLLLLKFYRILVFCLLQFPGLLLFMLIVRYLLTVWLC